VLFATLSFWEGVDVPGHALRLVIIDKLPFDAPNDPVTGARIARLIEQGIKPFEALQVPAAALALKQGFGRLIRTRKDVGIVAILDRRIVTRSYGKTLIDSLPPATRGSPRSTRCAPSGSCRMSVQLAASYQRLYSGDDDSTCHESWPRVKLLSVSE
jgi:Rad3-related DNA helicase